MTATRSPFRYEQIAADLRSRIKAGELSPRDKLPPETELAETLGVNRLTLRKALAILEEEGAILRQKGRGTFVADPARQAGTVLFVGDHESDFYRELYRALTAAGERCAILLARVPPPLLS